MQHVSFPCIKSQYDWLVPSSPCLLFICPPDACSSSLCNERNIFRPDWNNDRETQNVPTHRLGFTCSKKADGWTKQDPVWLFASPKYWHIPECKTSNLAFTRLILTRAEKESAACVCVSWWHALFRIPTYISCYTFNCWRKYARNSSILWFSTDTEQDDQVKILAKIGIFPSIHAWKETKIECLSHHQPKQCKHLKAQNLKRGVRPCGQFPKSVRKVWARKQVLILIVSQFTTVGRPQNHIGQAAVSHHLFNL